MRNGDDQERDGETVSLRAVSGTASLEHVNANLIYYLFHISFPFPLPSDGETVSKGLSIHVLWRCCSTCSSEGYLTPYCKLLADSMPCHSPNTEPSGAGFQIAVRLCTSEANGIDQPEGHSYHLVLLSTGPSAQAPAAVMTNVLEIELARRTHVGCKSCRIDEDTRLGVACVAGVCPLSLQSQGELSNI